MVTGMKLHTGLKNSV